MNQLTTLKNWDFQLNKITRLLNILRISIIIGVLVFITLATNFSTTSETIARFSAVKNETWILMWCTCYGLLTMFTLAYPEWQKQKHKKIPNATSAVDILLLAILTSLMGGTQSGFGILILPFLATSCLFSYGKHALIYAGFASSLVLVEMFWRYGWIGNNLHYQDVPIILNQIVLIGAFYLVSILTSYSANYLMRADSSVREHQQAYERINNLTRIVMNRMQEAAIVVDNDRKVWLLNRKAQEYFPTIQTGQYASFLHELTTHWQKNLKQDFETSAMINGKSMHVRAIPFLQKGGEFLTLFLRSEYERLSEAQTTKLTSLGQLTANLAHEIRNPLSAARQASGLLLEAEESNPTITTLCNIIEKNIARIDKMIEDVSALNKRDRITTETIDLKKFLENFYTEFQLIHPESFGCLKSLFSSSTRPLVRCDNMHLQQIMWNLCNNGWRHSQKKKGSLVVSIQIPNDNTVSIHVWDDGAGVSEEHRIHLFEPFFTTQQQNKGTGLGLYIARELAHANKGDLHYLIKEKAFELTLPKA